MYPDPGETIVIVTAAPTKLAMNVSRQQSGKGTVGTTDVGATLYSVPASITETVTGPGCARAGVKVNEQVGGGPGQPPGGGGMVEIAEGQGPARRDHVAFVHAKADGGPKREAGGGGGQDQKQQRAGHVIRDRSEGSPFPGAPV